MNPAHTLKLSQNRTSQVLHSCKSRAMEPLGFSWEKMVLIGMAPMYIYIYIYYMFFFL